MGFVVYLVLAFLVTSRGQYYDPVLFQQDGKGEVSGKNISVFVCSFDKGNSGMWFFVAKTRIFWLSISHRHNIQYVCWYDISVFGNLLVIIDSSSLESNKVKISS